MNPDKLFDYLDGNLSTSERAELEARLVSDADLQRELAVARRIHLGIRNLADEIGENDLPPIDTRGAILGRRIAIIFAVLVFLNVLFGIYAISFMGRKHPTTPNRRGQEQLTQALQSAAAKALPTPNLDVDEIKVPAKISERDAAASKIITAAEESGGSAAKNLSDENGLLVFAEIPAARENEFRERLAALGAAPSKPGTAPETGNRIIQIRVVEQTNH